MTRIERINQGSIIIAAAECWALFSFTYKITAERKLNPFSFLSASIRYYMYYDGIYYLWVHGLKYDSKSVGHSFTP